MSTDAAAGAIALTFSYRNHRGEVGPRRVLPLAVRYGSTEWHREPGWLLQAYDFDRHAMREFAMADIGAPVRGDAFFQARVAAWMMECFGPEIAADREERNHRFIEEALELVQSNGCTRDEAYQLVDYVFGRPAGERGQEVGGVLVTLAALCSTTGLDMRDAGEAELARVWTKIDTIRAKQAAKPKHSPLPSGLV